MQLKKIKVDSVVILPLNLPVRIVEHWKLTKARTVPKLTLVICRTLLIDVRTSVVIYLKANAGKEKVVMFEAKIKKFC